MAGGAEKFRYEVAPLGQKAQLLTIGGVCVVGHWYGKYGQYFWGWAPLASRDREAEARLGITT